MFILSASLVFLQSLFWFDASQMERASHHENISVQCIPPQTPLLNSKTGVCRGKHIFLIFAPKHKIVGTR